MNDKPTYTAVAANAIGEDPDESGPNGRPVNAFGEELRPDPLHEPEIRETIRQAMADFDAATLEQREAEKARLVALYDALGAHQHEVQHWPQNGNGWGVCECGATVKVENGKAWGSWHTCPTCTPQFYKVEALAGGAR